MELSNASVAKEYRFSVVMYGGVSLAIYMNGVTQELLHLVRSTARTESDDQFRFSDPSTPSATPPTSIPLRSTETVYREVARALNDPDADDVRFIVDVISGTSAGGINGIFLAKALTDDSLNFDVLQKMWIDEGALEKLLNDDQTTKATGLPRQESPRSLLCSDRMYIKLLDALRQMKTSSDSGKPLCDEVDLFVTTTDITGRVVPLRLADILVWERKYKEDFHFRYNHNRDRNDLAAQNDPFIAFVARCTSSFPFAFEPMQLLKVLELQNTEAWPGVPKVSEVTIAEWETKFFDNTEQIPTGSNRNRAFGDGGYLNNKPFSFVVDMLGRHSSSFPTERKLVYVEPTPDHPEEDTGKDDTAAAKNQNVPNALVNSYDALVKLPGYQPIHDDLQRVIERNRLVRKVTELSNAITSTIVEKADVPPDATIKDLPVTDVGDFGYLVLRVYSTTDELSRVLSEWFKFAKSSSFYYAVRCLVRAWRDTQYEVKQPSQREAVARTYRDFLEAYDIEYEKRKYRFIRQQINLLYCFDEQAQERLKSGFRIAPEDLKDAAFRKAFQEKLGELKKLFNDASGTIGDAQRRIRPGSKADSKDEATVRLVDSFDNLEQKAQIFHQKAGRRIVDYVLGVRPQDPKRKYASVEADQDDNYTARAKDVLKDNPDLGEAVQEAASAISAVLLKASEKAREDLAAGLEIARTAQPKVPLLEDAAKRGLKKAFDIVDFFNNNFAQFDTALFPLLYDTDVATPEPISIIRVSAEDATALYDQSTPGSTQKLAGASLAHFGAFLDRSFRTNDILWGRLDGAERIIRALLGTDKKKDLAMHLIRESQRIIIQDFLRDRQEELAGLIYQIAKSLDPLPAAPSGFFAKWRAASRARKAKRAAMEDGKAIFEEMESAKVLAIHDCVRAAIAALHDQNFAEAVEGFLTHEKIREYLSKEPPKREPDRRTTLESVTRSVRIMGGILQSLGKETEAAGGILIRAGAVLWWLVQAAIPEGLTGHFASKIFAALFWFEIVMIVGGTFFNQAVQSVGLKLLFFTTLLWLVKDAFQRYIRSGRRGLKVTVAWAVLALVIGVGTWVGISSYQKPEQPERPYQFLHDRR